MHSTNVSIKETEMNTQQRTNVPNAMRYAAAKSIANCKDPAISSPMYHDLQRSKNGYDQAFEGKGWNAHLSHKTYSAIKEKCGLN